MNGPDAKESITRCYTLQLRRTAIKKDAVNPFHIKHQLPFLTVPLGPAEEEFVYELSLYRFKVQMMGRS